MAFQGSLKDLPLPDIIQLVSVSGKSGVFNLTHGKEKGEIYLRGGQMVHATVENLSGEEAIYTLAIWSQGEFHFVPGVETPETTITRSNTNLLMEAARRLDEWRVLTKKGIDSFDLVPECLPRDGSIEPVSLNPFEWSVVVRIDGRRSLEEIARLMKTTPFDVAKTVYGLKTADLVTLKKAQPRTTASSGVTAPAWMSDPKELGKLINQIAKEAALFLGDGGSPTVDRTLRQAIVDLEAGKGVEAVRDLVRQFDKAISMLHGPAKSKEFSARAAALVSAPR